MAAAYPRALTFFFSCILLLLLLLETICCSGAFVELSHDSTTQVKTLPSSVVVTEYRVMVTDKHRAYLFLKPFACRDKPCRSEPLAAAAGSFVDEVLGPNRRLNVSNIVVTATDTQLGALQRTLRSVHASLAAAGLADSVRVSPELSLSSLRLVAKEKEDHGRGRASKMKRRWGKVMEFVRKTGSFVLVQVETEAEANGELAVDAEIEEVGALLGGGAGVVIHVRSRAAPSSAAMAELSEIEKRFLVGVVVDVPSSSPRRELGEARATEHDEFSAPVSNPATTPVTTVPASNPAAVANPTMSPGFVTVPSTSPGNGYGFATNPNLPPLYPEPTAPVTMPMPDPTTMPSPFTNPVAAPTTGTVTNPAAPAVTNPATTPAVTNPVTTYPGGGGGMPATQPVYQPPATVYQPPATTMPGTGTGTGTGTAWCVAKSGMMDTAYQNGIDYACGMGGADCTAIQPMGACYNPNTAQAHASYAFNSYFQRNPSAASCDFGGAGMLVNVNPSSGTCMYPTSSAGFGGGYSSPGTTAGGGVPSGYAPGMSGTGYSPAGGMPASGTMGGGGSGSTVLNANNPGGNSMYGGYDSPTGLTAGSPSLLPRGGGGWVVLCLVWMVTFALICQGESVV